MSLAMTPTEREAFLAEVHVAVVTVADDNSRGPLAIPLWYDYQPGGQITLVTDGNSRKAQPRTLADPRLHESQRIGSATLPAEDHQKPSVWSAAQSSAGPECKAF
jgi:hypothetical protein